MYVFVVSDISRHVTRCENITQLQQLPHQRYDVSNTSAAQFSLRGGADADTGDFRAYFPTDNSHDITDDDDSACFSDHYDDNYQVLNCLFVLLL